MLTTIHVYLHTKKGWAHSLFFLRDIYKLYPPSHSLYYDLRMYNTSFSCIDRNLVYRKDSRCIRNVYALDPSLASGKHLRRKINLFNIIPKLLSPDNFYTSAPCCTNNYSFNFNYEGELYHAYFKESGLTYEKAPNKYMTVHFYIDLKKHKNIQLSNSAIQALYSISGGAKKDLDTFAILCAILSSNYYSNTTYTMPSKNVSPLCLYTIFAPSKELEYLIYLISALYFHSQNSSVPKIKELPKTSCIIDLVNMNLSSSHNAILATPSLIESTTQINLVQKIIQRKPLSRKLSDGQNITLLNHLPMLCFTDSQKELNYLNATYKTKVFHFKNIKPPYIDSIEKVSMFMTFLCIYGLHLLYTQNWHTSSSSSETLQNTSQSIVQRFLHDCTSPDAEAYTYADDLYEHYVAYCEFSNSGTPLTRISFTKEVRKTCLCEYKKPRHSRSDNRYAFIGLKKDAKKSMEFVKKMDEEHINITLENFSAKLSKPLQIVNSYIQSLLQQLETPKSNTITVRFTK